MNSLKFFNSILFFFIYQILFSQFDYKVGYDYYYENSDLYKDKKAILYANKNESVFVIEDKILDPKTLKINDENKVVGDTIDNIEEVFKSFKESMVLSKSYIKFTKDKTILDPMSLFIWELIPNETKNILGYECNKAKIKFRGRDYYAFYTKEIEIKDGPWKWNNLPGLILEVNEKNGVLKIVANNIETGNFSYSMKLDKKNTISFEKAVEEGKIKFQNKKKELEEKYNGSVNVDFSNSLEEYDLN